MDASAKKVVDRIASLRALVADSEEEITSLRKSLNVMGLADMTNPQFFSVERSYREKRPFAGGITLNEACLKVLSDYKGDPLNKHQVEYFLVIGGYSSDAKDQTNSIEITLRRLADESKCQVERARG